MLKLKRTSRDGNIHVLVRDKEYLFNKPFIMALGIALAIHLGLFTLFHVAPFTIGLNETVFTPTRVEADTPSSESAIADVEPTIQNIRGLPNIPVSNPTPALPAKLFIARPMEYTKADHFMRRTFSKIEQVIYEPEFNPLIRSPKKPVEMIISGIIADQKLLFNGLEDKPIPPLSKRNDEQRLIYAVKVEGKTGKVFWYEALKPAQETQINAFAESVLRSMRFELNPKVVAMNGEIELHFYQEGM